MSVEQILNSFQEQLEKDALQYVREANRVAHYDAILRDSQRNFLSLTSQTSRLYVEQAELEGVIKNVAAFQSELEKNIEILENNVDDLFQAQAHVAPRDADIQRESAYSTALNVDGRLDLLHQELQSTLRLLDESQDNVLKGPVADVVKILNNHQNGLVQLEQTCRSMEQDIAQMERYLAEPR
jgi:predicted RNase H-like nuclease (RuvC/YqgF family)